MSQLRHGQLRCLALVVVGATTMGEIRPRLERLLGGWKRRDVPEKNVGAVEHRPAAIYLIDRPDSLQSTLFAAHVAPPKANPDEIAIEAMNEVLGASFAARCRAKDAHVARSMLPGKGKDFTSPGS